MELYIFGTDEDEISGEWVRLPAIEVKIPAGPLTVCLLDNGGYRFEGIAEKTDRSRLPALNRMALILRSLSEDEQTTLRPCWSARAVSASAWWSVYCPCFRRLRCLWGQRMMKHWAATTWSTSYILCCPDKSPHTLTIRDMEQLSAKEILAYSHPRDF